MSADGPWDGFWGALFKNAKSVGLDRRLLSLLGLAALAYWAMAKGVPPIAAISLFVIAYGYDSLLKFAKARRVNRNRSRALDERRAEHRSYVSRKRKAVLADAPELPLELPIPQSEESSDD